MFGRFVGVPSNKVRVIVVLTEDVYFSKCCRYSKNVIIADLQKEMESLRTQANI